MSATTLTAPGIPATMRAVVMNAPGDVTVETIDVPRVVKPTDAVIRLEAACVCGSDLGPYRGLQPVDHQFMGHEYVGTVVELGGEVSTLRLGDFVIGSFMLSDGTCEICEAGFPSRCANAGTYTGSQAQYMRVELADGSLVAVPGGKPEDPEKIADYLAASDVLGTGWFAAVAAEAGPGKTIAVVGDGAVGLSVASFAWWRGFCSAPWRSCCRDHAGLAAGRCRGLNREGCARSGPFESVPLRQSPKAPPLTRITMPRPMRTMGKRMCSQRSSTSAIGGRVATNFARATRTATSARKTMQ